MVEEAYVSFETAKLLKEKGFEGHSILTIYDENAANAYIKELQEKHLPYSSDDPKLKEFYYTKPTQQMAMRWLREEYKLAINIRIACKKTISYVFDIWDFEIIHLNKFVGGTIDLREQQFDFKSYEEAAEAAIKYCLENLI